MKPFKPERPYLEAWLRRTGKILSASGRLSQIAAVLAAEDGTSTEEWRARLRGILDGENSPSADLLTRIDAKLAAPVKPAPVSAEQRDLLF